MNSTRTVVVIITLTDTSNQESKLMPERVVVKVLIHLVMVGNKTLVYLKYGLLNKV